MAAQGAWVIPGHIGLGKFHIATSSTSRTYRIWNNAKSGGDLRIETTRGNQSVVTVAKVGGSVDIEGKEIMIRRYSSSSAGKALSGAYETLD